MLPSNALDPMIMLASGVHAQPGVYALLLGSGVSTGAGLPTGWGVVQELVGRAAAVLTPEDSEAIDQARADPEAWWKSHGNGEPIGYSSFLASVAPTPAARRGLLSAFFEPTEEEFSAGLKVPGSAHKSIAHLAKKGLVRIIVTTNFDRLVERALEDAGIPAQVVSRPEAVAGLTPLAHAKVTVLKLHGDYADLDMRNTIEELDAYPSEWNRLLDRIFDEYGLLICGWSGEWDRALVAAMERIEQRRYPMYWDSRSAKGDVAGRLLAQHSGTIVQAGSADELFERLLSSVEALDRLGEPPLTTALAITRLKRYLPDPTRRIDLHDLLSDATQDVVKKVVSKPVFIPGLDIATLELTLQELVADVTPLLHLLITGVYHNRDGEHQDVWIDSIQRLLNARTRVNGRFQERLEQTRHLPALLALRSAGIVAVHIGKDDMLIRLLTEPKWRSQFNSQTKLPAANVLHEYRVLDSDVINGLGRWQGTKWSYPPSHFLREELRESIREILTDDDEYEWANDRYEYRVALAQYCADDSPGSYRPCPGEFIGDGRWNHDGILMSEIDFREAASTAGDDWPWWRLIGGRENLDEVLDGLGEVLEGKRRWG